MDKKFIGKHNHYAIVSFPRNATKTLSGSLERVDYHNFGEFMDVTTSGIDLGWDASYKLNAPIEYSVNPALATVSENFATSLRYERYTSLKKKYEKSVVTIWPTSFFNNLSILNDLTFRRACMILITRENKFEQLLSYTIAKQFWYWTEGTLKEPTKLSEVIFCEGLLGMNQLFQLHKLIKTSSDNYIELDFYDITHGRIPPFKHHGIQYKRQMGNMYRYISNLDDLKKIYMQNIGAI